MNLNLKKPLAFFDLETTGINTIKDRIVEISIVKVHVNNETEIKTKRVNPEMPIPVESSLIHGIYDEDVKDAPTFKQIAKELEDFLKGCDLAGFNVIRFDLPLLTEEFLRTDINFDISNRKLVDAQRIFHMMEPRNLTAAYKFYCDKELTDAHSAEADTIATYEVFKAQVERYADVKKTDEKGNEYSPVPNDVEAIHNLLNEKAVDLAGRMVLNDKGEEVFNFGKHKGVLVSVVLEREPSYYGWIMKSEFPLDTKRKLTEIKLKSAKINF